MNVFEAVRRVAKPIKVVIQHLPYAPANINPPSSLDFSHRVLKLTCVFFRPNPSHRETPSNHFMHFSTPSYPPIILCLLRFDLDGRFARSLSLFGRGDNIVGFARLAILPELVSHANDGSLFSSDTVGLVKGLSEGTRFNLNLLESCDRLASFLPQRTRRLRSIGQWEFSSTIPIHGKLSLSF